MGSCQSIGALACSRNNTQRATNTPAGNNIENNEEDSIQDFDDGVMIEKNRDNYFKKEDFEKISKKFPNFQEWLSQSISISKVKPRNRRIKWKEGDIIGNGSFGKVVMGLNLQTGSIMAVKQVQIGSSNTQAQQDRIKALELEIELLSQLEHKNIVRYYGSFKTKNTFNIFLEYISGGTIASLIEKYGPLNENLIRVYTRQILEGLEYLHVRNTIHRDIKGANVLVDNSGICKLADFGTAKRISSIVDGEMKYMPSIRGTVNWMAPEVIKQTNLGRYSDIWSVGCTVLEMATGKIPWSNIMKPNASQVAALYQIARAESHPPIPEGLSPEAVDFLKLCFKINPAERPNVIQLLSHKFINGDSVERPMSLPDEERIKTKGRLTTAGSYTSRHKKTESLNLKNNEKPELKKEKSAYLKYSRDNGAQTEINTTLESVQRENKVQNEGNREKPKNKEIHEQTKLQEESSRLEQKQAQSRINLLQPKESPFRDLESIDMGKKSKPTLNSIIDDGVTKQESYQESKILKSERHFSTPIILPPIGELKHHKSTGQFQTKQPNNQSINEGNMPTKDTFLPIVKSVKENSEMNDQTLKDDDYYLKIDTTIIGKKRSKLRPLGAKSDGLNSRQTIPSQNAIEDATVVNASSLANLSRNISENLDITEGFHDRQKSQGQLRKILNVRENKDQRFSVIEKAIGNKPNSIVDIKDHKQTNPEETNGEIPDFTANDGEIDPNVTNTKAIFTPDTKNRIQKYSSPRSGYDKKYSNSKFSSASKEVLSKKRTEFESIDSAPFSESGFFNKMMSMKSRDGKERRLNLAKEMLNNIDKEQESSNHEISLQSMKAMSGAKKDKYFDYNATEEDESMKESFTNITHPDKKVLRKSQTENRRKSNHNFVKTQSVQMQQYASNNQSINDNENKGINFNGKQNGWMKSTSGIPVLEGGRFGLHGKNEQFNAEQKGE